MLILSLDRWPDGAVRIAWCGNDGPDRRETDGGVQVLVAEPGQVPLRVADLGPGRVPYVVRDIAETVRLGGASARWVEGVARRGAEMSEAVAAKKRTMPARPIARWFSWWRGKPRRD
jgi:hypothetical protein